MLSQYEINKLKSKLRELGQDEIFIERYIDKVIRNHESFQVVFKKIDNWDKPDPNTFILQCLSVGLTAAVLGGWIAFISP